MSDISPVKLERTELEYRLVIGRIYNQRVAALNEKKVNISRSEKSQAQLGPELVQEGR